MHSAQLEVLVEVNSFGSRHGPLTPPPLVSLMVNCALKDHQKVRARVCVCVCQLLSAKEQCTNRSGAERTRKALLNEALCTCPRKRELITPVYLQTLKLSFFSC